MIVVMRYILFLLLVVSCSTEKTILIAPVCDEPQFVVHTPKYVYGTKVTVTEGFYKGCSGKVTAYYPSTNSYDIGFATCKGIEYVSVPIIGEVSLVKVGNNR